MGAIIERQVSRHPTAGCQIWQYGWLVREFPLRNESNVAKELSSLTGQRKHLLHVSHIVLHKRLDASNSALIQWKTSSSTVSDSR